MKFIRDIIGEKRQLVAETADASPAAFPAALAQKPEQVDDLHEPATRATAPRRPDPVAEVDSPEQADRFDDANLFDFSPDMMDEIQQDLEEDNAPEYGNTPFFMAPEYAVEDDGRDDEVMLERLDATPEEPVAEALAEDADMVSHPPEPLRAVRPVTAMRDPAEMPAEPHVDQDDNEVQPLSQKNDPLMERLKRLTPPATANEEMTAEVEPRKAPEAETPMPSIAPTPAPAIARRSDQPKERPQPAETALSVASKVRSFSNSSRFGGSDLRTTRDIVDEAAASAAPPVSVNVNAPNGTRVSGRRSRAKTRLLGFNRDQMDTLDPLASKEAAPVAAYTQYPVGWLIVIHGAGRGAAFSLFDGVSQIGRGEGQTIRLDFGDNSISRENHASVAYDDAQKRFYIGHGGKANLVRLNNRPVLSTEELSPGDKITMGETTLLFTPLCGPDFSWDAPENGE